MSVAAPAERTDHDLMRTRLRTALIAASVAAAALAAGAPSASAGILVASAPNCTTPVTTQAFRSVDGDTDTYQLVPGGNFEAGAQSWSLKGGASVVLGNEPWKASGGGVRSLRLPPGASATSPVMCVGIEHPTARLFTNDNRGLLSTLAVSVIFETSLGLKASAPIGVILPGGKWKPSPKLLVLANLLPLLPGSKTPVQFQVTSVGLGTWWVDDFFVDPKCR
jgi:hypothetical protein